ncbi:DUF397 domain-containing protein [Saccharopolyspora sp. NFXS83]|uniref:DUF397 domain-containing protein n=1 Tax=Saccharopolyspora sp. NFXS83 TaxID=2993560 RepID=UPI00224AC288|nr:DUF397 domain-containing protein [Saccharopolyspora sp. NFXS83]MCX2732640.1 DUF397 domain-containing protein [Saccharopolyspora sp. NFXS83]
MDLSSLASLRWKKSSHSVEDNCVEVAVAGTMTAMRDSKDPQGPALVVSRAAFRRFVSGLG